MADPCTYLKAPVRSLVARPPHTLTKLRSPYTDFGAVAGDIVTISGYLQKKTRDGRWQKRWFETNGCFLTYYKVCGSVV